MRCLCVQTSEGGPPSISGWQEEALERCQMASNILVTIVPHQMEKVASLLRLIGCAYVVFGWHKESNEAV